MLEKISNVIAMAATSASNSTGFEFYPNSGVNGQDIFHDQVGSQIGSVGYNFSPLAPWGFAMAIIGAITLFFCFLPGFLNTIRTKDTSQMSLIMWIITLFGLAFLVIFYAMGMANSTDGGKNHVSSQFTVVFVCEGASLLMSIYVFLFKIMNMIKAKSMGITEAEYCAQLAERHAKKSKVDSIVRN